MKYIDVLETHMVKKYGGGQFEHSLRPYQILVSSLLQFIIKYVECSYIASVIDKLNSYMVHNFSNIVISIKFSVLK